MALQSSVPQRKSGRGALYIVWGDRADRVLRRSIASLSKVHPELPVEVIRLANNEEGFHAKARMFSLSPFSDTVFLDADTVVLDRLDFAFDRAARFGLACCIAPMTWAAITGYCDTNSETIMYNTGVLFFSEKARPMFALWEELSAGRQLSAYWDQGPFALAVERSEISPFVLPLNWNFQTPLQRTLVGPIKVWHEYREPPADVSRFRDYAHMYETEGLRLLGRGRQFWLGWRFIRLGLGLRRP